MTYDLAFKRVIQTDNKSALESNKVLTEALITAFPEIHDLNAVDSTAYFAQFEIDPADAFIERHFRIHANLNEMHFGFEFWMNTLWLEIGAARNPNTRFAHVRRYARLIVQNGFAVSIISGPKTLPLEEGIEEHFREHKEWTGFVSQVVQTISNATSSTTE